MKAYRLFCACAVWFFSAGIQAAEFGAIPFPADNPAFFYYESADFLLSNSERPPSKDAPWRALPLPDRWTTDDRWNNGLLGWYRFPLPNSAPESVWAIHLLRLSTNAQVFVNDQYIGDGGRFTEPVSRNFHRPLMFVLPQTAWRSEGQNYAFVRLRVYPEFAHLIAVRVGPQDNLRPLFEEQVFAQTTLSQAMFVIAVICALLGFTFYSLGGRENTNLFFALASAGWSIYCLNLFIRDIPVSANTWWSFIHTNVEWTGVWMILFCHRLLKVPRRTFEWIAIGYAAVATLIYANTPIVEINDVSRLLHMGTVVAVGYTVIWLGSVAYRTKSREAIVLCVCLLVCACLGVNDMVRHIVPIGGDYQTRFYLLQFGAAAMFVIIATYLSARYFDALAQARRTNTELAAEVGRVKQELEHSFAAQQQLAEQATRADERERIYQDLHDDVGARLLTMVYQAQTEDQAETARLALADMRELVNHRSSSVELFADRFAAWESEMEERCDAANLILHASNQLREDQKITSEQSYHLTKILRELLSNSIKHANATTIRCTFVPTDSGERLEFSDDGEGLTIAEHPGLGLPGVLRRVTTLQGELHIHGSGHFQATISVKLGL